MPEDSLYSEFLIYTRIYQNIPGYTLSEYPKYTLPNTYPEYTMSLQDTRYPNVPSRTYPEQNTRPNKYQEYALSLQNTRQINT